MKDLNLFFSEVRKQFPALNQSVRGKPLVYLDSAATSLKPQSVIDRMTQFYTFEAANVHRGSHYLGDLATQHFEKARKTVADFIGARHSEEIIFARGTTEAINLVASSWGETQLNSGDEILITVMEHHANIVPWQMLAEKIGAKVVAAAVTPEGDIDLDDFKSKLSTKTRLVAFTACSNVLGTKTNAKLLTALAHKVGAKVLVDGAQLVSQAAVNVQEIECDFFVFSGHKLFGPYGVGVLFGKKEILEQMPPYQGGGSMISKVTLEKTTFNDLPFRFEAGTPHISGVLGLHTAIDFVSKIGFEAIHQHEETLLTEATSRLLEMPDIKIYGQMSEKAPVIAFNLEGAHFSDVAQIVDQEGVAIRAGHHCAQPLMAQLGVSGTLRASFSIYNNLNDVRLFIDSIHKAREMLL